MHRDMGASMTNWKECFDIKEFCTIGDWVYKIIQGFNLNIDQIYDLKLKELWGQYYKKGDYQSTHAHNPLSWSFVYYVNAPKGSAPLVFSSSNKKIFPKPGMLVLFPSWLEHYVPKHKCEEIRSVVLGDFFYSVDWKKEESSKQFKVFRGE